MNEFLTNNKIQKLSNSDKEFSEPSNVEKEILISLIQLHNGKTLDTNGLPPDFYNCFWID